VSVRKVDWDGVLTLGLTVLVVLTTLGGALFVVVHRVVAVARMCVANEEAAGLLLVPGKRLLGDRPDGEFCVRLRRAAALARTNDGNRIVVLGGVTEGSALSEAAAGEAFLRSLPGGRGLRIMRESASLNTLTNLRNVRDMLGHSLSCKGPVTLISNRYHLARLGLIADSLGIEHVLWPAEDRLRVDLSMIARFFREAMFCLWFRVGKQWAVLTRNGRMLGRVT
jgi:uncharacterized SAM-binding protein YcdF (DUF218 family)